MADEKQPNAQDVKYRINELLRDDLEEQRNQLRHPPVYLLWMIAAFVLGLAAGHPAGVYPSLQLALFFGSMACALMSIRSVRRQYPDMKKPPQEPAADQEKPPSIHRVK